MDDGIGETSGCQTRKNASLSTIAVSAEARSTSKTKTTDYVHDAPIPF